MSVQLAAEIWSLVRESIPYDDREQLADSLVSVLVDQGFDLDDIRYEFDNDSDVQDAIKYYVDEDAEYEREEYSDEDEDEDY